MNKYSLKVGDTYGNWTVISEVTTKDTCYRVMYLCRCGCGTESYIRAHHLVYKKSTKCKNCIFGGVGDLSGTYMSKLMYNAKKRGLEFSIGKDYLYDLFINQEEMCCLSGLKLVLDRNLTNNSSREKIKQTASLDRIDSSKGYVEGNVQWVHKDINNMKMGLEQKHFIELCKKITEHDNNK